MNALHLERLFRIGFLVILTSCGTKKSSTLPLLPPLLPASNVKPAKTPAKIVLTPTTDLSKVVAGQKIKSAVKALVNDTNGEPIENIEVNWSVKGGGSFFKAESRTNNDGSAASPELTIGKVAGDSVITATVSGSQIHASIDVNASAGNPSVLSLDFGSSVPESGLGNTLTKPLTATVKDALGNPLKDANITWSISGGGRLAGTTSKTDRAGKATSPNITLSARNTDNIVTAKIGSLNASINIKATLASLVLTKAEHSLLALVWTNLAEKNSFTVALSKGSTPPASCALGTTFDTIHPWIVITDLAPNTNYSIRVCKKGSESGLSLTATVKTAHYKVFADAEPSVVIGQPDFTTYEIDRPVGKNTISSPQGHPVVINNKLYIPDTYNHRILGFNQIPSLSNADADFVIGQLDFSSNFPREISATSLNEPRTLRFVNGKFFVTDSQNNRILIWNTPPVGNVAADIVIGQPTKSIYKSSTCDAKSLREPSDIFIAGEKLIVADRRNHRVLIWNQIPITDGAPANVVLGRKNMTTCDEESATIDPSSVWSDGSRLFVADSNSYRILVWNSIPTQSGASPDFALGQPDLMTTIQRNPEQNSLQGPSFIAGHGDQFFVHDDNRLLIWNKVPKNATDLPDVVLGQSSFNSNEYPDSLSKKSLVPRGSFLHENKLIVTDINDRFLVFDLNTPIDVTPIETTIEATSLASAESASSSVPSGLFSILVKDQFDFPMANAEVSWQTISLEDEGLADAKTKTNTEGLALSPSLLIQPDRISLMKARVGDNLYTYFVINPQKLVNSSIFWAKLNGAQGAIADGSSILDSSPSQANGRVQGIGLTYLSASSEPVGFKGRGIKFSGKSAIELANRSIGNFKTGDFTISFWLKGSGDRQTFISKRKVCMQGKFWDFHSFFDSAGVFEISGGSGNVHYEVSHEITSNVWQMVTITRSRGSIYLYINGNAVEQLYSTNGISDIENEASLVLGNGVCDIGFEGSLADVAIWDMALSPEMISAFYKLESVQ